MTEIVYGANIFIFQLFARNYNSSSILYSHSNSFLWTEYLRWETCYRVKKVKLFLELPCEADEKSLVDNLTGFPNLELVVLPVFIYMVNHGRQCDRLGALCAAIQGGRFGMGWRTVWSDGGSEEVKEILGKALLEVEDME